MPDEKIDIEIGTKADVKGLDQAKTSVDKLNAAVAAGDPVALTAAFEELVTKAAAVGDAIADGDLEAAKETYAEVKTEIQALTSEFEKLPPEIEEFNDQFHELEKSLNDGESFKKLSNEVRKSNKSLSKLERLKVAETFANIVSQGRNAGAALAKIGTENQSLAESFLDTTEAATEAISAIVSGYASGGPIGAALAGLSIVLGNFIEQNKQLAASIGKAFKEIDTTFKQSEASIQHGIDLAKELSKEFEKQNEQLKTRQLNHEANLAIQQKEAELQARREDNDFKLRELQISGDLNLTEDAKTKQLAALETEKIQAEFDRKQKSLKAQLDENSKQLKDLLNERKNANDRVSNARSKLEESQKLGTKDELKQDVEDSKIRLNDNLRSSSANLQQGVGFNSFFQGNRDEIEEVVGNLKKFKKGQSDILSKDNSIQENAAVAEKLLKAIDGAKDGLISGTKVSDTKTSLHNIIAIAASIRKQEKRNNELIARQQAFQKELDAALANKKTLDSSFDNKSKDLFIEKNDAQKELEALPGFQKQQQSFIDQRKNTKLNTFQQRREQQKKQLELKRQQQQDANDSKANAVINQFLAKIAEVGNTPEQDKANHFRSDAGQDLDNAELQVFQQFIQSSASFSQQDRKLKSKMIETLTTLMQNQTQQIAENKAALEKINAIEQAANSGR